MDDAGTELERGPEPLQYSVAGSHAGRGAGMTAWARLARNSEKSCGNGGAMESQQPAFHSSLGISQKTRDSHIPTAPATGCFTGKKIKSKKRKSFTQKT